MACACASTTLSSCGCCQGVTQETPETVTNRPGLNAIAYRVAAYPQIYETLLARITQSGQPSLRALKSRTPDDFTVALLDAFSVMGDVLTFYSERIANENYLRTATERRSVRELANLVGYRMSPGVAADAYLAFTIDGSAGAFGTALTAAVNAQVMPELVPSVIIPVGTQVQSIPGPGQMPQTFETVEQIYARAEWNAMTPLLAQAQTISTAATVLLLSGGASNVKAGDPLLLVPSSGAANAWTTAVQRVSISSDAKTTELDLPGWTAAPAGGPYGYRPNTFVDGLQDGATQGTLSTLQAAGSLASAAALLAGTANWWDAGDVLAAATANQWPLDQLSAIVNQQVAAASGGTAYIFRQQAAPFGYNSPNYYSLPAVLIDYTAVEMASPPARTVNPVIVPPAYPTPWDPPPSGSGSTGISLLAAWGGTTLYLDGVYAQALAGSYIVLIAPTASAPFVAKVVSNTTTGYSNFAMAGKVSLLTIQRISGPSDLSQFYLRNTAILCQAEALPLAPVPVTAPIAAANSSTPANSITLNAAYLGLVAGQQIVFNGTTISTQNGVVVAGPVAAEQATLAEVTVSGGDTVITLADGLANSYLRSSVAINANVANATHGQTVTETLGSGDGTQTFQSFVLHQAPLTYTLASTTAGSVSTLRVQVDGVLWIEVPYLYGHGPNEQIFITAQDDNGVTTLTFGDGVTGSRLPTGTANVVARYRFGIGTAGLMNANQLSQLVSRPLGVRGVNNPLASEGAADPEDLDSGRGQATLAIMTLGRVVSLEDYQDFALSYVGIGKALATWTWDGQQRAVVLTVAGVSGPIDATDPVLVSLAQSLAQVSEPGVMLFVLPSSAMYFNLNATVSISASYDTAAVQAAIASALIASFGWGARRFGQPVFQSEVIAAIQAVAGVIEVTLMLYLSADPAQAQVTQIAATVPAAGSRNNELTPAQLLTLDPGTLGISLVTVTP